MKQLGLFVAAIMLLMGVQLAWAGPEEGGAAAAEMEMPPAGSIVHTELFGSDLAVMQSFYSDLFGWTFTPMDETYVMFEDGDGNGGGITSNAGPMGGEPGRMTTVIYLWCLDIPAKLAEIEAHGGSAVMPLTPIPGYGAFAIFSDPSGNNVGLFTAGGE